MCGIARLQICAVKVLSLLLLLLFCKSLLKQSRVQPIFSRLQCSRAAAGLPLTNGMSERFFAPGLLLHLRSCL